MPYKSDLHTVIETPTYLADAAGLSDLERVRIVMFLAANPTVGDLIPGTGGARKIRFGGRGKGKSGGYRTISFYAAPDIPVFLLALINKGERADLSMAERNALHKELRGLANDYRAAVKTKVARRRIKRGESR